VNMAFYRNHPVTLGLLVSLVGMPILVLAALYYPSFYELMFKNPAWTRLVVFTAAIFPLAIAYFAPRQASAVFWTVMAALFVMHIIVFVVLIHYFRQLSSFDYTLYGPLEALFFVYIIPRATRMIHRWHSARRRVAHTLKRF